MLLPEVIYAAVPLLMAFGRQLPMTGVIIGQEVHIPPTAFLNFEISVTLVIGYIVALILSRVGLQEMAVYIGLLPVGVALYIEEAQIGNNFFNLTL